MAAKIKKRKKRLKIGGTLFAFLVYAFIYTPIAVMVVFSFNDQRINYYWKGFTFKWYEKLFTDSDLLSYLWLSLFIAVLATVISVIIGTIGALGLMRFEFMLKKVVNTSLYIPVVIPEVVMGLSLLMLYESVNMPLGVTAILLAHVTFCIPFVVIIMRGRLAGMDKSVEEASMDLGANRLTTFFKITLPMLIPGIMSSAFMSFTLSIDDVIISNFVSGPTSTTLPVKILSMVKVGLTPDINALATIMVMVLLLGIILNSVFQALMKKRASINIKTYF
ncbi:ABC transporter permease subunit [Candidatus Micrarchaeota archaeon]|jgi:spermidine/putrescine transport system permease protein|nr:ABC transporter permease subunit [Candidatus Micrarchaeota archaeon]